MSAAAVPTTARGPEGVRLFLCGDVMTGRAIDQLLPHPAPPQLHEPWVRSAVRYIELAEQQCGQLGRGQDFGYPWGDALALLAQFRPALRIVNLETAVTHRSTGTAARASTTG
jgi:poly-gamma-glutamate capsule biosynthesis protein CapA/YwtB (metallophosphatase superfamily)